ncbi:hypothetical protein J4449_01710 [Candidatus Woesearchaeota archaeon]|nr:hypothetical protein [Candidatus Woesearchaeota archaeon]
MRDDKWLNQRLNHIWSLLFIDVSKANNVNARFKGKWRNKFGHIKLLRNKNSEIVVNSLFKDPVIPEYIIDITLAHELVHYSHGFNSPLKKLYKHPHKGGIVEKELKKRGFENMIKLEKDFIKNKWFKLHKLLTYDL